MGVEQRLTELGLTLPQPTKPMANYVPAVRTGNLLFISGHGPYNDGETKLSGKLGRELTVEEGYQTARNVGLNCLASVKAAIGDLDRVKRVVKLLGMVNCTDDFTDIPTATRISTPPCLAPSIPCLNCSGSAPSK